MPSQGHLDVAATQTHTQSKGALNPRKEMLLVGVAVIPSIIPCKNLGRNTEKSLSDCDTDVLKNYKCSQTQRLEPGQTADFMDLQTVEAFWNGEPSQQFIN